MADYELFVNSDHSLESIAILLGSFLGKDKNMSRIHGSAFPAYKTYAFKANIILSEAFVFEDDYGIPFSEYNFLINIEPDDIWEGNEKLDGWMSSLMEMLGFFLYHEGCSCIGTIGMRQQLFAIPFTAAPETQ